MDHVTDDGFKMERDEALAGFHVFTPQGIVFAWAETMEAALAKVARERRERIWSGPRKG